MLIEELKRIVGPGGWKTAPEDLEAHLTEWRGAVRGATPIMVSPSSVNEVAEIIKACAAAGTAVVPQGGNTGLCAGAVPDTSGEQVLLSLSRLNRIRDVRPDDFSIVVEAGCILQDVQTAAAEAGRLFALSLSAEGTAQIGGNISTDAGGINVIRYGTARAQVLGLEVVLPDGRIWDGLRSLRKDTAGFDLKQLFIGAEGTLGVITAACLKLYPLPGETTVALIGLSSAQDAIELLARLRTSLADRIQAFELVADRPFRWVEKNIPNTRLPFDTRHEWYVLMEAAVGESGDMVERELVQAMADGLVADVVIAKNAVEAESLWRMRHSISEAQKPEGACMKHDISVPVGSMAEFLHRGSQVLEARWPDARLVAFGHVGDGNLHYNVTQPASASPVAFSIEGESISRAIYELVQEMGGSISAEHGIGVLKRPWLHEFADPLELEMMRTLKAALDPGNILNPGKVI